MPVPDVKRLAAEISVQHGIRVDPDDPMMAVVTLNRLMLEQAIGEIVDRLHSATRDLQDAAEKVQLRAGARLAREVRDCATALRAELLERDNQRIPPRVWANPTSSTPRKVVIACLAAFLLFLAGVCIGAQLRSSPCVGEEAGRANIVVESHP